LRLTEFEGEEQIRQAAWEDLNRRRQDVAGQRDEARRSNETAAATLAGAAERRRMLARRLETVVAERGQLELLPDHDARIERLAAVEERGGVLVGVVQGQVAALRERQQVLRREAGRAGERLEAAETRREVLEARISESRDRASLLAVQLAEMRVRDEAVAEGLRRDVDASEADALAAPRPELEDGVDPRDRLRTLEADLRRMGSINPLAAAEYEELSAEVELLESQLADLEESRRELRKVIAALDTEMAALFLDAFEEINGLYQENFGLVFPGGRGRLRLVDGDRPLESGVEVEAQPHGKKVGRLSLLSGGERSLAALAFLFAVFRARPSPFYILDEVEAALDDANLHRFLRLVDTLRRSAQLVIITHQQQTMEAADMLYGVTMEPGASSKIIAKRMSRVTA
jgi:chromosome segregation protein